MRKFITTTLVLFAFCTTALRAQTVVFSEDFETLPLQVTSSGSPGWDLNTRLQVSGVNSDSAHIDVAGSASYLETDPIDLTGLYFVTLNFNNIAKIEFFDGGFVEVSVDGGNSWIPLIDNDGNPGGTNNCFYLGPGLFTGQGSKFQEANYSIWAPGGAGVPDNTWWQAESFDISQLAGGEPDVRIRFRIADLNNSGGAGRAGWFIDDIEVLADPCEFIPPIVNQVVPLYPPIIYNLGPFVINAEVIDASGLNSVTIHYLLNGIPQTPIPMTNVQGINYTALLPIANPGDEFCYYIEAIDASNCDNTTYYPGPTTAETICFVAEEGVTFPYCESFDGTGVPWTGSGTAGTIWELGPPAFGTMNTAYSPPNAWVTNLAAPYTNNAVTTLTSPEFSFQVGVGAKLEFWQNRQTQAGNDGTRLEWATNLNGPWNILGSVGCANCENWYNTAVVTASNQPGWTGNSNGWVRSSIVLDANFNNLPQVWFRFTFNSNAATTDAGMAIDNFCITLPEPDDVGAAAIIQPAMAMPAGNCVDVIVQVRNYGLNTQTSFPVSYSVNNGPPVTGTFNGSLAPGASAQVTLPCLTIPAGTFSICAYTELPNDANHFNDTVCGPAIVGVPVIQLSYATPYSDNFDGANAGWTTAGSGTATTVWELGTPAFGVTNTSFSAPSAWDVNLNSAYGNNAACELLSPYFNFSNVTDAELSFWRNHRCEANADGTRLEYSINNGQWTTLGGAGATGACWENWYNAPGNLTSSGLPGWTGASAGSGTGTGWIKSEASCLGMFNNAGLVQFRFVFTSNGSVIQDGFSVDDFQIRIPAPLSASPLTVNTNVANNSFIFPGQPIQFSSPLSNTGTTPLNSVNATVTINGIPIFTDTVFYSPPLNSNQSLLHNFTQLWNAIPGVHEVCVITSDPNVDIDQNPADDTTCITISVFDTVTVSNGSPYCTDFETGPQWVSVNAFTYQVLSNSWQLGTPAQTVLNGAYSGINAWMTRLTSNYSNTDSSGLFTPVFSIDNTKCYRIGFWHKFDTELFQDGGIVEYSVDYAQTWNHVGYQTTSNPDWFNTAFITGLGGTPALPGWSGTTSVWIKSFQDIDFPVGSNVVFRFRFGSDNTTNYEGWAIDDFCFEEVAAPCILSINDPTPGALTLSQNYPNPFQTITEIAFHLPESGTAKLSVTNLLGQEIIVLEEGFKTAGTHTVKMEQSALSPGIYYYMLEFNNHKIVRKMVVAE
jgi:hypothetical protein